MFGCKLLIILFVGAISIVLGRIFFMFYALSGILVPVGENQ